MKCTLGRFGGRVSYSLVYLAYSLVLTLCIYLFTVEVFVRESWDRPPPDRRRRRGGDVGLLPDCLLI